MTGSRAQLYNGITLIVTFFGCRLVWGTYQTVLIYRDIWAAVQQPGAVVVSGNSTSSTTQPSHDPAFEVMRFAGSRTLPLWLTCTYLGSNTVLGCLNFYWFGKMIDAVKKRFLPAKEKAAERKE